MRSLVTRLRIAINLWRDPKLGFSAKTAWRCAGRLQCP
jgi:hypothetical protein